MDRDRLVAMKAGYLLQVAYLTVRKSKIDDKLNNCIKNIKYIDSKLGNKKSKDYI